MRHLHTTLLLSLSTTLVACAPNLYAVEMEAISVRQQQLNNMIALHRALGGGFDAQAVLN